MFAFDNKYAHQQPSAALIEAARNLADTVGARVLSDAARPAAPDRLHARPAPATRPACAASSPASAGARCAAR